MEPRENKRETLPDERPKSTLDLEPEDPELEAWLAAREADLEEMAWATFDQTDDRSWQ